MVVVALATRGEHIAWVACRKETGRSLRFVLSAVGNVSSVNWKEKTKGGKQEMYFVKVISSLTIGALKLPDTTRHVHIGKAATVEAGHFCTGHLRLSG